MAEPAIQERDGEAPADEPAAVGSNVAVLRDGERTIHIVGTAHVSRASVDEVIRIIAEVEPDVVCVELDEQRYEALTDADRWKKLDIFKVFRERRTSFLMANLALTSMQRQLGKEFGVKPGEEMLAAIDAARERGSKLELIDRAINLTLKRTWGATPFWEKFRLSGLLVQCVVAPPELTEEDLEKMKNSSELGGVMSAVTEFVPSATIPFVDERDRYMASRIMEVEGDRIIAVVGVAHLAGIKKYIEAKEQVDRAALETLPPPSRIVRALKWVIPIVILAAFAWGISSNSERTLQEFLYAWILPNSLVSALGAALAGGRVLSILTAFVSSPITSLNPLIGTAMVVGPLEAWLRRPTVEDCENISDDVQTVRGWYRNPFLRTLLVAFGAGLGSAVGMWIGTTWVLALLAT